MKTRRVQVLVRYNGEMILPRDYLAHEIPVLEALANGYPISDQKDLGEGPDMSAREILIDLKKKYNGKNSKSGAPIIDEVYPDGSRDIEAFYRGDYVPSAAVVEEENFFADAPAQTPPTPVAPSRDEVAAQLQALGVPFSQNTPTKHLIALLERAKAGVEDSE